MVLVSILGDFHSSILPLINQFKEDIQTHILIYDDYCSDVKAASTILNGIAAFKSKYALQFKSAQYKIDEDSKHSVESLVEILSLHCQDFTKLYVNTTDGLASINTLLSLKLVPLGANILAYDMFDNSYNIINQTGLQNRNVTQVLSIQDHFLLRDIKVEIETDKELIKKYKKEIQTLFSKELHNYLKVRVHFHENNTNNTPVEKILHILLEAFNPKNKVQFVQGTLYELYVATLLLDTDIDDFEVGSVVKYPNHNEFDVLFMKENHLHMIECKMAIVSKSDLVYKYSALQKLLDNDGKMLLLTRGSEYSKDFTASLSRAKNNNILIRGFAYGNEKEFYKDLRKFFKINLK